MFTHQTVLSLRSAAAGAPAPLPVLGHFQDHYVARNVMEVKQILLRCVRGMNQPPSRTPDLIVVDAGRHNRDIKAELERWMDAHPRLDRVRVMFPPKPSWILRRWKQWIRREGTAMAAR